MSLASNFKKQELTWLNARDQLIMQVMAARPPYRAAWFICCDSVFVETPNLTEEERNLRAVVVERPHDALQMFIYADWLDERGRLVEANALRAGGNSLLAIAKAEHFHKKVRKLYLSKYGFVEYGKPVFVGTGTRPLREKRRKWLDTPGRWVYNHRGSWDWRARRKVEFYVAHVCCDDVVNPSLAQVWSWNGKHSACLMWDWPDNEKEVKSVSGQEQQSSPQRRLR